MRIGVLIIACIFLLANCPGFCQKVVREYAATGIQYGASVKLSLELTNKKIPTIRCGISGGVAGYVFDRSLLPSLHVDFLFYNNGFGSRKPFVKKPAIESDILISGTLTTGCKNRFKTGAPVRLSRRNDPLYYFSTFSRPPLQNPYNHSFSVGSILAYHPSHKHPVQQIGFMDVHIGQFQFSYYNDGTPFQLIKFGDYRDRYFTGGGSVTWTTNSGNFLDHYELSYFKYTGFTPNTFEIVNDLDLSFVSYHDVLENYYNKSLWSIGASSTTHRFFANLLFFNYTKWDGQHMIHRKIYNGYHRVSQPRYITPVIGTYWSEVKIKTAL